MTRPSLIMEWFAGLGCVLVVALVFWLALTGIAAVPAEIESGEHRLAIAKMCPHLPNEQYQACIDWLRQGGAK